MEVIGVGLQAIGKAVGSVAFWWAMVYIVGLVCKTMLIYEDKMTVAEGKDWFSFFKRKDKGSRL